MARRGLGKEQQVCLQLGVHWEEHPYAKTSLHSGSYHFVLLIMRFLPMPEPLLHK